MKLFQPLFSDFRTGFYTVTLGLVIATFFAARIRPDLPLNTGAILLLFIAWMLEGQFQNKLRHMGHWWFWLPLVFFLLHLLGLLYSENETVAWENIERKGALPVAVLLIATSSSFHRAHKAWGLFVFVNTAIVAMVIAYIHAAIIGVDLADQTAWTDLLTYDHLATAIKMQPIYLSFYLVFALYALIALYLDRDFQGQWYYRNAAAAIPALCFLFVAVIMLSSRMEILVLFATGGLLSLLFLPPRLRKRALLLLLVATIGASAIILSSADNRQRFKEMFDLSADYTENRFGGRSIRLHKWKNTLECWTQSPVLGVGTGDMQDELNKTYRDNDFKIALEQAFNPHNQYLQTLLTLGLPGLTMLLLWLWSCWWWGWKHRNWLLFAFGTVVSLSIITESMLERQWGVVFIAVMWVLLVTDNFEYFRRRPNPAD